MNAKTYYLIIFLVLITAVVVVVVFTGGEDPAMPGNLPPGHPDIGNTDPHAQGNPSGANVRKDFIERLNKLQAKVDAQPENDTTDVLSLARMLYESHQAAESIPYFQRIVKLAPKFTDAKIDLSVAYYQMKRYDDALNITKDILKSEPDNTTAHYNLGVLYETMEQHDKAKEQLNMLIEKYPNSDDAKRAQELLKQL